MGPIATRTLLGLGAAAGVGVAVAAVTGTLKPAIGAAEGFGKGLVNGINRRVPLDGNAHVLGQHPAHACTDAGTQPVVARIAVYPR